MTTDQPQWMKNVAAAHAERRHPPKVAADQPAPDSSLEEARERVRDTRKWLEECIADRGTALDVGHTSALDDFEDAVEAAARAEVIRDVEAAMVEMFASKLSRSLVRHGEPWPVHIEDVIAVVRALSQGGEGSA